MGERGWSRMLRSADFHGSFCHELAGYFVKYGVFFLGFFANVLKCQII